MLLADVSNNTLFAAQKVNLVSKCGLKRFRAARSAPQSAPGAAASAAASTGAEQASPAAAAATPVKVRDQACATRYGALTLRGDQSEEPGDLVMALKFRAPPSGLHLLQVRPSHATPARR